MRRREFVTLLDAAAVAVAASAQQLSMPVVGFINSSSLRDLDYRLIALRRGLGEVGYVEGQNVVIEYRWADGHYDRLPTLAADLVRRRVSVIAVTSTPGAMAAKAASAACVSACLPTGHALLNPVCPPQPTSPRPGPTGFTKSSTTASGSWPGATRWASG